MTAEGNTEGARAISACSRDQAARRPQAAAFFDAQPPWYRRTAIHWVISAKRDETRERVSRSSSPLRGSAP